MYKYKNLQAVIVCTPPLSAGGLSLQQNFQKRGSLTRPQHLMGGCWERGGDFFPGGLQFLIKNNLKYLMTNKVYKQKQFPAMTKN